MKKITLALIFAAFFFPMIFALTLHERIYNLEENAKGNSGNLLDLIDVVGELQKHVAGISAPYSREHEEIADLWMFLCVMMADKVEIDGRNTITNLTMDQKLALAKFALQYHGAEQAKQYDPNDYRHFNRWDPNTKTVFSQDIAEQSGLEFLKPYDP